LPDLEDTLDSGEQTRGDVPLKLKDVETRSQSKQRTAASAEKTGTTGSSPLPSPETDRSSGPSRWNENQSSANHRGQKSSPGVQGVDPDPDPEEDRNKNQKRHAGGDRQRRFLLLVFVDGRYTKRLVQLDITNILTDYDIFVKLNELYRKYRGRWRALTALETLRTTKVCVRL
jgi:hypothetical protein